MNELMSRKHKKVCTTLNYIQHFLISASAITHVFKFMLLLLYSYTNYEFYNRIKICAIAAGIKKDKSIIKKKKKKHNKIEFLPRSKLNSIEVLISKALINSNISFNK